MIGSWSAVGAQPNPLGEPGPSMMRPVDEGPPHVPSHSAKRSYDSEIPQGAGWCGWWFTNPDEVNHRRYNEALRAHFGVSPVAWCNSSA